MSHQVLFDVSDDSSSNVDFEGEETSLGEELGDTSLTMNASLEIRSIINDYDDTLRTATKEIKTLTK